mmetsp:Transcript_21882/g.55859  ORF Transcript_21882/g.55859 Transcript_21882/m.55859 type:complete len:208 (-) Transcript_21882:598-1221(-)
MDDAIEDGTSPSLREPATAEEGIRVDATLEVVILASPQGIIISRSRLVDGPTVVCQEDHQRAVPHLTLTERVHQCAHRLVQVQHHRGVQAPIIGVEGWSTLGSDQRVDAGQVLCWNLEWSVYQMKRVEQEERRRRVMCTDDGEGLLSKDVLLVGRVRQLVGVAYATTKGSIQNAQVPEPVAFKMLTRHRICQVDKRNVVQAVVNHAG